MTSLRRWIKKTRIVRSSIFLVENGLRLLRPRSVDVPDAATPGYWLAAMIRVKDEGRFLPEWLAHHVGLGFQHFVVYDNNSSDGTRDIIEPFVREGLVTHVAWPTVPASPSCHLDFFERFGNLAHWVAFLDADEFLVELTPGALGRALDGAGDAPAIAVNWRYYGSAGFEEVPDGLVTERFDRANAAYNHHVKVIVRCGEIAGYRNSHNFYYRRGRLARTPEGRRVFGSFVQAVARPELILNHYVCRSRQDFERKTSPAHGFVDASGAKQLSRRSDEAEEAFRRHNDVVAPVPESVRRATAETLAKFGYPEATYRAVGVPGSSVDNAVKQS